MKKRKNTDNLAWKSKHVSQSNLVNNKIIYFWLHLTYEELYLLYIQYFDSWNRDRYMIDSNNKDLEISI